MFKVNNKDTTTTLPRVSFFNKVAGLGEIPLIFTRNIFAWFFLHITTLDNKNYLRSRKINHNIGPSDYGLIFPTKKKNQMETKLTFTCSKSTIETIEIGVKHVQN